MEPEGGDPYSPIDPPLAVASLFSKSVVEMAILPLVI
jgi:hypothetical protein